MPVAQWNRRFETGITRIDAQHKSLFDAVNRLAASLVSEPKAEGVKESLDFLAQYTLDHFQAEEHFMHDMAYPDLDSHMAEHARLMNRVEVLQGRLAQGQTITRDVTTFYAGWLKHHICGTDMAYVRFMKGRQQEP
jgi:hemerythrin-like metal-binding protein